MLQVLELKIFLTNNCFAIYISLTNLQPYQQRLIVVTSKAALTNSLQLIQLHRQVQEDLKLFWFLKRPICFRPIGCPSFGCSGLILAGTESWFSSSGKPSGSFIPIFLDLLLNLDV
jgi:hypothetical protein